MGDRVTVTGAELERVDEVLTGDALSFLAELHTRFDPLRASLLARRQARQQALDEGAMFDFLPETETVRQGSWTVAPPAPGLVDRRVEITGPTERKMTVNALNSGAKVWLADFEDANTPLWENMIQGQLNLIDALDRRIDFQSPDGRWYRLGERLPTIVVRPRGWHLPEKHVLVDGQELSASLFDFGLYVWHCTRRQLASGAGPYFYLPKLESHLEARLWNDVFAWTETQLGLATGTIRATVLIETIAAAFEMDEILYELRDHAGGLNAGRWDYLFSLIKKFRNRGQEFVLPDRNSVTMTAPFMRAYSQLLVATCHRRGAHAIGGMAAFIPSRRDPEVNAQALAKVEEDKRREAGDGYDGSWVAHPDLVEVCQSVFDQVLGDRPNQLERQRLDVTVGAAQLLDLAATPGSPTEAGLRNDVSVGLQYLAAWLRGTGAVGIFNLMEDAATAEIARSQVWQWLHNDVRLDDGQAVTEAFVERIVADELAKIAHASGDAYDAEGYERARKLFAGVALADEFEEFLTLPAYRQMP